MNKIASNLEWSKYLETTVPTILVLDIDLVNLRNATYFGEGQI